MPQLLTNQFSVQSAISFYKSISRTTPVPETLFLGIGKQTEWDYEEDPDAPNNAIVDLQAVRNELVAIKKISTANIAFVIPRYNWITGQTYDKYASTDPSLLVPQISTPTKRFYVITDDFNVYECLDNNGNQPSVVKPAGTSVSPIITGDGYTWKFMFNLSSTMISTFLLQSWIPVPFDTQKTAFQVAVENAAVYATGTPPGGHGASAVHELGAMRILLSQAFEQSESSQLPTNIEIRQVSVICNPRLLSGGAVAAGAFYNTMDSNNEIDLTTGEIIFLDNREVINRAADQTETTKLIIGF